MNFSGQFDNACQVQRYGGSCFFGAWPSGEESEATIANARFTISALKTITHGIPWDQEMNQILLAENQLQALV
jgi:hypothetical protein